MCRLALNEQSHLCVNEDSIPGVGLDFIVIGVAACGGVENHRVEVIVLSRVPRLWHKYSTLMNPHRRNLELGTVCTLECCHDIVELKSMLMS